MKTSYRRRLYWWLFGKPLEISLVEACEAIPGLRELGHNDEDDFDYLRIRELADALRQELLPRGIVMIPNDLECDDEIFVADDEKRTTEARVKTEFTVTDGRRSIKMCAYGAARNANEGYAVAAAQTMALKSVLKRLSFQYGDKDDAEFVRLDTPKPPKEAARPCYECGETVDLKQAHASKKATGKRLCAICLKLAIRAKESEIMGPITDPDFVAKSVAAVRGGAAKVAGILDKKVPRSEEMTGD